MGVSVYVVADILTFARRCDDAGADTGGRKSAGLGCRTVRSWVMPDHNHIPAIGVGRPRSNVTKLVIPRWLMVEDRSPRSLTTRSPSRWMTASGTSRPWRLADGVTAQDC